MITGLIIWAAIAGQFAMICVWVGHHRLFYLFMGLASAFIVALIWEQRYFEWLIDTWR